MVKQPLISVITPTLNRGNVINTAIKSVANQNFSSFEHLVIDSDSKDNTKSILKRYPSVRHYIEKDKSSHHAINKGIKLARGKIICVLNSDDWLESGIFKKIEKYYLNSVEKKIFIKCRYNMYHKKKLIKKYNGIENLFEEFMFGAPGFNSFFFGSEIFKNNLLDTNYNFSADRHFLLKIVQNFKCIRLNEVSYNYRLHEDSRTLSGKNNKKILLEHLVISKNLKKRIQYKRVNSTWFVTEFLKLIIKKKKKKVLLFFAKNIS